MRTIRHASVLAVSALLLAALAPSAAASGGDPPPREACGVAGEPAGLNCGRIGEMAVSTYCVSYDAGVKSCSAGFRARVDVYQWVGAGFIEATMAGHCRSAGFSSWSAADLNGLFSRWGPYLYCDQGYVDIAPGACHTFEATVAATFGGGLAPRDVARTLALEVCN